MMALPVAHRLTQTKVAVMDVLERIDKIVKENPVVIFMKGTPQMPQCGFSSRAAQALQACGQEFAHVNVLMDMDIFENLPRYQNWPTFPQIYINGELIGGCDITLEMYQKGELKKMVDEANKAA
jgi:monothiol glutaredoxin